MTDLNNSRAADSSAGGGAAESKNPNMREEQARSAPKEREYLRMIEPPEDWARVPVTGQRG